MSAGETRAPLPQGWTFSTVGEVGRVQLGRQRSPEHHQGEHMRPYLRVANVFEDRIDTSDVMQMNFTPDEFETYRLMPGDILLNEGQSRELVGRPAMYQGEVADCCFTNSLVRYQPGEALLPEYALYQFRLWVRSGVFTSIASITTNIAHLGAGRFASLPIGVPPLAEQRRIVAKLDAVMARSRAARAALEAVPALLEQYRRAVLAAAFRGELTADWRAAHPEVEPASALLARVLAQATSSGSRRTRASLPSAPSHLLVADLPATWTTTPLETLAAPVRYALAIGPFGSNLKTSDYTSSGVPLVFVRDIRARSFGEVKPTFVSVEKAAELGAHQVLPGDLLVTKMGDPPGDTAVYPLDARPGIVTADCIKMTVSGASSAVFLMHWLESDPMRDALAEETQGVAQQKVSLERFRTLHTRLPPLAEQHEIVRRVEAALARIARVKAAVEAQRQQLDALDRAVLDKAFRGELVPQHPDDEPAAQMLARIQAERAATGGPRRARRGRGRGDGA